MPRYTYTLNPDSRGRQPNQTYRRSQLEKMTTFQLRELCRKERLVIPTRETGDREGPYPPDHALSGTEGLPAPDGRGSGGAGADPGIFKPLPLKNPGR